MPRPICLLTSIVALAISMFGQARLTVNLLDNAALRPEVRAEMKRETSRILLDAGVELEWVECEIGDKPVNVVQCSAPAAAVRVMVQLLPGTNAKNPRMTGRAIIERGTGVYASVYLERVAQLAREANWGFADLLGHAVAHELGHLLLGTSAHSPAGVMRARWETEDLRRLSHHGLVFLPGQLEAVVARSASRPLEVVGQR
jgi:hypothetical protein